MRKIAADFDRKIDLPGIGPCPRPVDIDRAATGFSDLVSLRIYAFAGGDVVNGESEDDEVLIVLLRGAARIGIEGVHKGVFDLSVGGVRAVYMPPGHLYRLAPQGNADIAYARARTEEVRAPRGFMARDGVLSAENHGVRLEARLAALDAGPLETAAGSGVERLAHCLDPIVVAGRRVAGWETLALDKGERAEARAESGPAEVLIVAAR